MYVHQTGTQNGDANDTSEMGEGGRGEGVTFAEITYMCRMGGLNKYLISISNYIFPQLFDSLSDRNKSDGGSFSIGYRPKRCTKKRQERGWGCRAKGTGIRKHSLNIILKFRKGTSMVIVPNLISVGISVRVKDSRAGSAPPALPFFLFFQGY